MAPKAIASASSAPPACTPDRARLAPARAGDDAAMDNDEIRSDPDEQAARGLTPDEQRAERDRESRATDETKYELAAEQTAAEAEAAAERIGEPREPRED